VIGDGENYIDAMYVDDAIRAFIAVLTSPPAEKIRCIDLGIGSGETINQVVRQAAHAFGLEAQIGHEGSTAEYIRFMIDPEPFRLAYQFTPVVSLEDGLRCLASYLEQREIGGAEIGS
jgi:nucleoside-diphosphate-sugar epimerase